MESQKRRMHPREVALRDRKTKLEFALVFMQGQALKARVENDPCRELYDVAVECIERERMRVWKELR